MTEWAPTWRVEVDWAGNGTWIDISTVTVDGEELGRVRNVDWQRGKNSDFGRIEASTATVVLDNRDRNLEPDYPDSDYWPNVRPMRPIRVSSVWDGGDLAVITGVVEGWPPTWDPSGSEANISVPISDAFIVFAGARLPSGVHELEATADGPEVAWKLGESSGTTAGDSSGNGHHADLSDGVTFNSRAGLIYGDPDTALLIDPGRLTLPAGQQVRGDWDFTVVGWVDVPDAVNYNGTIWRQSNHGELVPGGVVSSIFVGFKAIANEAIPYVEILVDGTAGVDEVFREASSALTPGIHRIAAYIPPLGASVPDDLVLNVDGVDVTGTTGGILGTLPAFPADLIYTDAGSDATLDEIRIYDGDIGSARHAAHYAAGTAPWEGDLTGERIEKLLALVGVTGADIDIDPGRSTLQAAELGGQVLDPLREIEETEGGWLYATRDGVIRFRDRDAIYDEPRSNTVQVVFGDDWEDGDEIPYTVVEPVYSVADVINSVEANRSGGATFTVEDETSIVDDGYGYRSHSMTLLVDDDREVIDAAGIVVAERAQPRLRFRKITVDPSIDPDNLWPVVLELDVGDRVAFRKRPPGGGDPVDVEAIIVGVAGRAPAGHCTIDFTLEPPPLEPFAWADDEDGTGPGLGWAEDDGTGGGAWTR